MQSEIYETYTIKKPNSGKRIFMAFVISVIAILLLCFLIYHLTLSAPENHDEIRVLQIEKGMSVQQIAERAKESGVVRSSLALYAILTYAYDPTTIYAGTYSFEEPMTVFDAAQKLALNDVDPSQLSITIPEGTTRKQIARIAQEKSETFDINTFLEMTKNNEGYLFPDTYYVSEDLTAEELVTILTETFSAKFAAYKEAVETSRLTEYEVLILASIIEREANSIESMKMVSGILQNRLELGMALQADASIEYVLDKELSELVPEDLEIDTPYNTYLYAGLPPTPIGNPGLDSIEAVLYPTPSEYFFYITGNDGNFYYAQTFDEHRQNIQRHLR